MFFRQHVFVCDRKKNKIFVFEYKVLYSAKVTC